MMNHSPPWQSVLVALFIVACGGKIGGGAGTRDSGADTQDSGADTPDSGADTQDSGADTQDSGADTQDSGADTQDSGANACILRVAEEGSDSGDGSRWDSAFATVQAALEAASARATDAGCSSIEVWVAAGTYTPTHRDDDSDGRTATFQLVANVALYGGFKGTEVLRGSRDVGANVTTLSGDLGTKGNTKDNSYHVVTGATGATLDGFTVSGGNADGGDAGRATSFLGGGMYNADSSPTVTHCTFLGNSALFNGGGMYNVHSSPTVTGCTFENNTANYGGGMYSSDSSPTIAHTAFIGNNAGYGGGMRNDDSASTIADSTFENNAADYDGGGVSNSASSPTILNCVFDRNSASYGGGGLSNSASSPTVTNCVFMDNRADDQGDGVSNALSSSPTLTNCTFSNTGPGMSNSDSSPTVTNCIFWDAADEVVSEIVSWGDSLPRVSHSIVRGGYPQGTDIITEEPFFVDPGGGDLRLRAGSPAIDAGDGCADNVTMTDLGGNRRIDVTAVTNEAGGLDLGALEYQGNEGSDRVITGFDCG
jgi:parallel beta-helix repeat protein